MCNGRCENPGADVGITAPLQLVLVENPEAIDLDEDVRMGYIVSLGSRQYWLQRVVYTGIDINRVNRIDVKQGTFNIDFYLWMRYSGEDDTPTQMEFPAFLRKGGFDPKRVLKTGWKWSELSPLPDHRRF